MSKPPVEVEIKFYLADMNAYEKRVRSIGSNLVRERTLEVNYRFDTPDMSLTREHRVLRLRQDNAAILTYKGPSQVKDGANLRPEIEFEVSDFSAARALLEALGYRLSVKYEKWRTIYQLDGLEISLDEMPFGNFTEIEGGDPKILQKTASLLALDWNAGITKSYLLLFEQLKKNRGLKLKDLTFEALREIAVSSTDLGVKVSDIPKYL